MGLCLLCGLWMSPSVSAFQSIFYQPQVADQDIDTSIWPNAFRAVRDKGFEAIVFQWTASGDDFEDAQAKQWLRERVGEAVEADLKIIVGLYEDPDMFSAVAVEDDLLEPYFLKLTQKNQSLAEYWVKTLPAQALLGWYLPFEIDDRRWRAPDALAALTSALHRDVQALKMVSEKPVYISSFFRGNATPTAYEDMLTTIRDQSGVRLWVQDGSGNRRLSAAERQLYLSSLSQCQKSPVDGFVFEIFRQKGTQQTFQAKPLAPNQLRAALKQRAPCDGDSVFFSLRYFYPLISGAQTIK